MGVLKLCGTSGYATEGAIALRDHALNGMRLRRIGAFMHPGNAASIRVAQKIGMQCEGEFCWDGDPSFPALRYVMHAPGAHIMTQRAP